MSAGNLVTYLTWAVYVVIFLAVAGEAIRQPRRANVNIALLFALPAAIIVLGTLNDLGAVKSTLLSSEISGALILSLSYVLLRLVDDFSTVPWLFMRAMEVSLVLVCAGLFVFAPPRPLWLTVLQIVYFVGLQIYAAVAFARASRRSSGVTKRRMRAVAAGSVFLGLTILVTTFTFLGDWAPVLSQICGLGSAVTYFLGFAPPALLRRAWQEPELRAFLSRAAALPRLPTTRAIVEDLEQGAATSLGAPHARLGLFDSEANVLRFEIEGSVVDVPATVDRASGKVYLTQQPLFVANAAHEFPAMTENSRIYQSTAMLVAPVTAGDQRLGVLSIYAPRAPIFARDDLELVKLLADQAAVILESRALIDEAARVRAREEATRLKDDFLSAAAHDLKTPLTALVARAQLLERRAVRVPDAPADLRSIRSIITEAQRLQNLVLELLDASRAERGQIVGAREPVDLTVLAQEVCARQTSEQHHCRLDALGPVVGMYDRNRMSQLIDNLIENAVKYSPAGGDVTTRVWCEDGSAHLTVSDHGIGIPQEDLAHIFDRFYRARNVNDRQFAGMGLGLFICRAIAEQHGGTISVCTRPGEGATFHVKLPAAAPGERQDGQAPDLSN